MLTEDRQQLILRELALNGSLNASEFAAKLGTSGMTVLLGNHLPSGTSSA